MATVNKHQFVNFLKSLNLDLSEFSDLSIDNICVEACYQQFLSWFCTRIDCDNILLDDEAEVSITEDFDKELNNDLGEHLENHDLEMYQGVLTALETRLDADQRLLAECRVYVEGLHGREKYHWENYKKGESTPALLFKSDKTSNVLADLISTLQVCFNTQPYVPKIVEFNEECENLSAALHSFHTISVSSVMQSWEIEDYGLNSGLDNLEKTLVDSQVEEEVSFSKLPRALAWLENGADIDEWQIIEEINKGSVDVENMTAFVKEKLRIWEIRCLLRKLARNNYLLSALKINRELKLEIHLSLLISQSFIENRLTAAGTHETSVYLFENFLKDLETNIQKSLDIPVKNTEFEVVVKSSCRDDMTRTDKILGELIREFYLNQDVREDIVKVLNFLRTGPSLQFNFLPVKLHSMLNHCQSLRIRLDTKMRQLVASYFAKKDAKNPGKNLLWVTFINEHSIH